MKEYGATEFYIKQQLQYGISTGMLSMKSKCCSLKTEYIIFDGTGFVKQTQKRKNRTDYSQADFYKLPKNDYHRHCSMICLTGTLLQLVNRTTKA